MPPSEDNVFLTVVACGRTTSRLCHWSYMSKSPSPFSNLPTLPEMADFCPLSDRGSAKLPYQGAKHRRWARSAETQLGGIKDKIAEMIAKPDAR